MIVALRQTGDGDGTNDPGSQYTQWKAAPMAGVVCNRKSTRLNSSHITRSRMPSSRSLVVELGISRIPVLNAYAQLLAEGYFESRKGAGTFVSAALPESLTICKDKAPPSAQAGSGPRPVARRGLLLAAERPPWAGGWGAFSVHQPAFDRFPFQIWSSMILRHCRSPRLNAIHNIDPLGTETFREAVCTYLRTARAVHCEPRQVMVVSGSQQALEIAALYLYKW